MKQTAHNHPNVPQVESRASLFALPRCSNVTEGKHYYAGPGLCASRAQSQACLSYAEMQQSVRSKRLAARVGGGFGKAVLHEQQEGITRQARDLFHQSLGSIQARRPLAVSERSTELNMATPYSVNA